MRVTVHGLGERRVFSFVVDTLAAYRLTRLAAADTITQPMRERFIRWTYRRRQPVPNPQFIGQADEWQQTVEEDEDPPKLATLITCRWCVGVYAAAAVVLARRLSPRAWDPIAIGLAIAAGAALVAGLERE